MLIRKAAAMFICEFVIQIQIWTEGRLEYGIVVTTTRIRDSEYFSRVVMAVRQQEKLAWRHGELLPEREFRRKSRTLLLSRRAEP
jgi:hypothetical protein